jgi:uncharacterized membrane protein
MGLSEVLVILVVVAVVAVKALFVIGLVALGVKAGMAWHARTRKT